MALNISALRKSEVPYLSFSRFSHDCKEAAVASASTSFKERERENGEWRYQHTLAYILLARPV